MRWMWLYSNGKVPGSKNSPRTGYHVEGFVVFLDHSGKILGQNLRTDYDHFHKHNIQLITHYCLTSYKLHSWKTSLNKPPINQSIIYSVIFAYCYPKMCGKVHSKLKRTHTFQCHVMGVPVTTAWRILGLRMEGSCELNKQSQVAEKGWYSIVGVEQGANNSSL
jgi:hypothetical protein